MSLVILTHITFSLFAIALICKVLTGLYTLCERLVLPPLKSSLREPLPCYALIIDNNVLCARICEGLRQINICFTDLLCVLVSVLCLCSGCSSNAPSTYQSVRTQILAKNAEASRDNTITEVKHLREEEQKLQHEIKNLRNVVNDL